MFSVSPAFYSGPKFLGGAERSTAGVEEDKVETALPWTPVEVSPQSMGDPCAKSPFRGHESPRHLLFKKWYRQETWVDPELVHDSGLEVMSNDSVLSEDAGSLSHAARMFRNHLCQEPWRKFNLAEIETSSSAAAHSATALAVLSFLAPMPDQNDEEDLMCYSFKVYVQSACVTTIFLVDNVARAFRAFVDSFFGHETNGDRQASPKKWLCVCFLYLLQYVMCEVFEDLQQMVANGEWQTSLLAYGARND